MKNGFYLTLTLACIACAVYCWLPQETRLLSVAEQQQELVNRGHDIKIDGKFGPNTNIALNLEIAKAGE